MAVSKRLRFEVFKRDNFTCQYCGAKPPDTVLEVDHVHPRCEGGTDEMSNLKTACWNCNRGKGPIPIPPPSWVFRLVGGPWDGQSYQAQFVFSDYIMLWICQDGQGNQECYEDEWVGLDPKDEEEYSYQKFRYGHPGFSYPIWPNRPEANRGWFHAASDRDGKNPDVLGGYFAWGNFAGFRPPVSELHFADVQRLLVEFAQ